MKKKYFIMFIILIVLLAIFNLNLMLECNGNKGEKENVSNESIIQIKEDNSTNNLLVESTQKENVVLENMVIPNSEVLQENDTISPKVEKEKKKEQSTKSKTGTKDNKVVKQEKTKQNKAKSSSSTSNNSQGSNSNTQQWKTETHYGGEIPDSSGYNGGYWMKGEELDLSGIDMSDWSIK